MFNFSDIKTTQQIISERIKLSNILPAYKDYLAHSPNEGLFEHTELTSNYLEVIVRVNKLEKVIDNLIRGSIAKGDIDLYNWIKRLFIESIIFHDLGKVNVNYQSVKLKNPLFRKNDDIFSTHHSLLSSYLYLVYYIDILLNRQSNSEKKQITLFGFCILFSYAIAKHHSSDYYIDFSKNQFEDYINDFIKYVDVFCLNVSDKCKKDFFTNLINNLKQSSNFIANETNNEFYLWCMLKLQYSLLTAVDYYATNHYKSSLKSIYSEEDFGILTNDFADCLINQFKTTKIYNQKLLSDYQLYLNIPLSELQNVSNENLQVLRQKIGAELIEEIKQKKDNKIFYIEAPTGGGKTNLSMLAIIQLLNLKKDEITKIFYVFPFTTLITQTYKALKETFSLSDKDIIQIHSKAGFHTKNKKNNDEDYDNDRQNYIDYLFVNYPISLMSHIKFFDILKSNSKDINYILHRLANSIVVIDELQSYSPSEWDKLKYLISNYAETFNIRFIIMSATLPKIDGVNVGMDSLFEPLIRNVQSRFLQNPNFKDRVTFDFSLLDKYSKISTDDLKEEVIQKSIEYAKRHKTVHTIIEFIHKKSTTEFFNKINNTNLFHKIFVLSGTILEPRRKEIIDFLKNPENRNINILLITTQVVEAGVDIDMDLGFKNISLLDSDEQLAGRVNRNAKKDKCCLYLFKFDEPFRIYKKDFRYDFSKCLYSNVEERQKILENKDFNLLYDLVIKYINTENKKEFTSNFQDYQSFIRNLLYDKVDSEFKLIDNSSVSFFVPLNIPLQLDENGVSPFFSKKELEFLNEINCIKDNYVIGTKIWQVYDSAIKKENIDFYTKKINHKKIAGILSNFTFSMYNNEKLIDNLKSYLEYNEETKSYKINGYYCFNSYYDTVYDMEKGLNESNLNSDMFIF